MGKKINKKLINSMVGLKKQGLRIEDISKKLNLSDRTINKYTKHIPHPNRTVIIPLPKQAKKFSKYKAEIIGYLCAEGNDNDGITSYKEFDHRRNKTYNRIKNRKEINFSNMDKVIQDRFIYLMKKLYGYNCKPNKKGTIYIQRRRIIEDLRKHTLYGSRRWKIPPIFLKKNSPKMWLYHFIRSYADGDATVDLNKKEVRFDSINRDSLTNLYYLFKKLKIRCRYHSYPDRGRIAITDIKKYKNIIGFLHPTRKEKLSALVK